MVAWCAVRAQFDAMTSPSGTPAGTRAGGAGRAQRREENRLGIATRNGLGYYAPALAPSPQR